MPIRGDSVARTTSRGGLAGVALAIGLFAATTCLPPPAEAAEDLRQQIYELALEHGFVVRGLDRVRPEPTRSAGGNVAQRLEDLLAGYSYALVRTPGGRIEKVVITGTRVALPRPRVPRPVSVPTMRRGAHHVVGVELVGPGGVAHRIPLVIDTGATSVVLPTSLIPVLGFGALDLRDGRAQTANGVVAVKQGRLASVSVGTAEVPGVEVSFVADELLSGNKLLGMSFLKRFQVTLDDEKNQVILLAR